MISHSHTLGGFEGLASDPVRWLGSHLAIYGGAAIAAGIVFLTGAAVYSYVWGDADAGVQPPDPPVIRAPVTAPKSFPAPVPKTVDSGDMVAGVAGEVSALRVGAVEFSSQDVTGFVVDSKAYMFSTTPSGTVEVYSVFVPYGSATDWLSSAAAAVEEQAAGQQMLHGVSSQTFRAPYPADER